MKMGVAVALSTCLALAAATVAAGGVVPSECPSGVKQVPAEVDSLGYRRRVDRCEGRYAGEPFGGQPALRLAGFVEHFAEYPLDRGAALSLTWTLPTDATVAITATSRAPRTYYRMDASSAATQRHFRWPLGVLAALEYRHEDIGVVAYARLPVGTKPVDVLVPLRIGVEAATARGGRYSLLVVPGTTLRRVTLTVAAVGTDGAPGAVVLEREATAPFPRFAEEGVELVFDRPRLPGIYALVVGAEPDSDSAAIDSLRAWFYSD